MAKVSRDFDQIASLPEERVTFFGRLMGKRTKEEQATKWLLSKEGEARLIIAKKSSDYANNPAFKEKVDNLINLRNARLREIRNNWIFFGICVAGAAVDGALFAGSLSAAFLAGHMGAYLLSATGAPTLAIGALSAIGLANLAGFSTPILNRVINLVMYVPNAIMGLFTDTSQLSVAKALEKVKGSLTVAEQDTLRNCYLDSTRNKIIGSAVLKGCQDIAAISSGSSRSISSSTSASSEKLAPSLAPKSVIYMRESVHAEKSFVDVLKAKAEAKKAEAAEAKRNKQNPNNNVQPKPPTKRRNG